MQKKLFDDATHKGPMITTGVSAEAEEIKEMNAKEEVLVCYSLTPAWLFANINANHFFYVFAEANQKNAGGGRNEPAKNIRC